MAQPTDPSITDLRRELAKAHDALMAAESHLARHAEMNAALHCSERVMYSPLHAKVDTAIHGIKHALARTEDTTDQDDDSDWAYLVWDLDRCQHGRHQGDACGPDDDCNGTSAGNPHLRPGAVIGYDMRRNPIVMPDRDHKHDPTAWRPSRTAVTD
ncbi:hypothetical protein AB0M89_12975 [Streptomyces microflavus]|uniref:hypothetical protein n=1 Tax=Streptomyces microflavus TaxID=1919 RepID=UPI0034203E89